jgi:hypothetical protein
VNNVKTQDAKFFIIALNPWGFFVSLEGRVYKKRKKQAKGIEEFGEFIFLHNTKFSWFGGTQKLYWRGVLEGLYEFFKFNLCYNIRKIKNILIISIYLSFSMIKLAQKMWKISLFLSILPSLESPPLQTCKQSLIVLVSWIDCCQHSSKKKL